MAITSTVDQVAPELTRLRFLFVNLYLSGSPEPWVLIDAGLQGAANTIVETAEECFGTGTKPEATILTHGHFNHVGAFPELFDHWDVPVYARRFELPHLTGQSDYPPPDPTVGRGQWHFCHSRTPTRPLIWGLASSPCRG